MITIKTMIRIVSVECALRERLANSIYIAHWNVGVLLSKMKLHWNLRGLI